MNLTGVKSSIPIDFAIHILSENFPIYEICKLFCWSTRKASSYHAAMDTSYIYRDD